MNADHRPGFTVPLPGSAPRPLAAISRAASVAQPARQLWVAIHLPRFTLDMATRGNPQSKACVLVEGEGHRQQVAMANLEATRLGIKPGMSLGAAQALGEVLAFRRVPAAESRALDQLCAWAHQFTPMVTPVAPDGLLMEIRGSLGLFGGLQGLLGRVRRELHRLGFKAVVLGTAPTPLAATWLARAHQSMPVESLAALPAILARVPLEVLELPRQLLQDFRGIGVHTVGECLRLPRDSLARRFSPAVLTLLDQALGRVPDPRPAVTLPETFFGRVDFFWEIRHAQALSLALERLLLELTGLLRARVAGIRELRWRLHHAGGRHTEHLLRVLEPTRDAEHLLRLSRDYFLRTQLPEAVCGLELEARDFEQQPGAQVGDLFSQAPARTGGNPADWARFVERLRARLGEQVLQGVVSQPDHRPERAGVMRTLEATRPGTKSLAEASPRWPARPTWLIKNPLLLDESQGRPRLGEVLQLDPGKERIEGGWWDGQEVARDYFVARDGQGAKFWVFRDLSARGGWYLHGIFE